MKIDKKTPGPDEGVRDDDRKSKDGELESGCVSF